jgi:hypothetical protein
VLHEPFNKFISITVDTVDVNTVVVGSDSEVLSVWRVSQAFAPFFWVLEGGDLLVKVLARSDRDFTEDVTNCDMTGFAHSNTSGHLVLWKT